MTMHTIPTSSIHTPPLQRPVLHSMLRPDKTRLAHTSRLMIDIEGHDKINRIAQPDKRLPTLRLLVQGHRLRRKS